MNAAAAARSGNESPARPEVNTLAIYTLHLFSQRFRAALIWGCSIALYAAAMVLAFPSFEGKIDVSIYPESVREAFNITSFDRVQSFLSVEVYSLLPLVLAFYPITLFSGALAGAEERGTLDVLLGTPLRRRELVIANAIAGAVFTAMILAMLAAATWLAAVAMNVSLPLADASRMAGNLWPITIAFGGIAMLASAVARQRGIALAAPALIMFVMYFIDVTGKIASGVSQIRFISAFRYYGDAAQDGIWWSGAGLLLLIGIVATWAAIVMFERRDIYA